MYNTDFLPQQEKTRRYLFGNHGAPQDEVYGRYQVPSSLQILECFKDTNGEWVPKQNDQTDEIRNGGE